jgi:hypothetical protein
VELVWVEGGDKMSVPLLHYAPENKGLGFTKAEKRERGLLGLVPPRTISLPVLVNNALEQLREIEKPLEKYVFLVRPCPSDGIVCGVLLIPDAANAVRL